MHDTGLNVDPLYLCQYHAGVWIPTKHVTDGWGDLAFGENPGGHLIEQRLEEVVIPPIQHGYRDGGTLEGASGEQTAETTADDRDAVARYLWARSVEI
jgi:hypothetical protein